MRKLALALMVGALGVGVCMAQGSASSISSDIQGVGIEKNMFFMNSIHYDTTFCNYENEYDFFYHPWELPDIQFDRTGRLGNNHDMSGGGYKALYWAQFANNNVWNSGIADNLDVLTAAGLVHVGPGLLGVSAAIAGAEDKTTIDGVETFDDSLDLTELYVTWGMNATDKISWGVSLDVFASDLDTGVSPATSSFKEDDLQLKGGVKFKTRDDFWWSVRLQLGAPEIKNDADVGPLTQKLDGSTFGIGGDVNWVFDGWDLEVNADFWVNDWDVTDSFAGVPSFISDDVTEDIMRLQARAFYKIGRAEVWKGLKIVADERDVKLVDVSVQDDRFKDEEFAIEPSAAIRFPFGCKDCSVKIAGILGAGWTLSEVEQTTNFAGTQVKNEFTDSDGAIRLGLEVKGERFAFDMMWESDSDDSFPFRGSPSFSESSSIPRENIDNERFIVGATIQL